MNKYMVFDVESVGIHGEGFAVGYVVVDEDGNTLDQGMYACSPSSALGDKDGREWVKRNLPKLTLTHDAPWMVRAAFWRKWREWTNQKAILIADCAWPVEARFLARCVDDNLDERSWQGPNPLHDLASIILAQGCNPAGNYGRNKDEEPQHNPLMDARQSARILLSVLRGESLHEIIPDKAA